MKKQRDGAWLPSVHGIWEASLHSIAELAALFCTHPYIAFFLPSAMESWSAHQRAGKRGEIDVAVGYHSSAVHFAPEDGVFSLPGLNSTWTRWKLPWHVVMPTLSLRWPTLLRSTL